MAIITKLNSIANTDQETAAPSVEELERRVQGEFEALLQYARISFQTIKKIGLRIGRTRASAASNLGSRGPGRAQGKRQYTPLDPRFWTVGRTYPLPLSRRRLGFVLLRRRMIRTIRRYRTIRFGSGERSGSPGYRKRNSLGGGYAPSGSSSS
jgi:hypothetical protein